MNAALLVYMYYTVARIADATAYISSGVFVVLLFIYIDANLMIHEDHKKKKKLAKWLKITGGSFLVSLIIGILIPSEKTIGLMIGAPVIIKELKEDNATLERILDKSGRAVEVKLDEIINDKR